VLIIHLLFYIHAKHKLTTSWSWVIPCWINIENYKIQPDPLHVYYVFSGVSFPRCALLKHVRFGLFEFEFEFQKIGNCFLTQHYVLTLPNSVVTARTTTFSI
jgi:hypothetical protein